MSKTTGVLGQVRWTHEEHILAALRTRGAMRRGDLARVIGISRTTLSEVTGSMIARGAIQVVSTDAGVRTGSGRPAEMLALDPRSGQYLGVDFGHSRVHIAVADATHEVIAEESLDYVADADWSQRVKAAFELIDDLAGDVTFGALQGIGIGVPGPYSHAWAAEHDEARTSSENAQALVAASFRERFGLVAVIDNNTRYAALGEATGDDGDGEQDLIYLRIADGIGGGVVVGGRLVSGSSGIAGELGHVTVAAEGGAPCRCGKKGCLETVASVPRILAECRRRGHAVESIEQLETAIDRSDPDVADVLRFAGTAVGRVLATAVLTINPAEVVIGGALARIAPGFVQQIAETVSFEVHSIHGSKPSIRASAQGDGGGARGALVALYRRSPLLIDYPESSVPLRTIKQRSTT